MKTKLSTLIITLFYAHFSYSQTDTLKINRSVQEIRDNFDTYKKIEKINNSQGARFVYLKDKDLKLIAVKAIESDTEKNVEWYYVNGEIAYIETNWLDTKTNKNIYKEKNYFNNGHLLLWWNSQRKFVDASTEEFKKMDSDLITYCTKIKEEALK